MPVVIAAPHRRRGATRWLRRARHRLPVHPVRGALAYLLRFAWIEAQSCAFAVALLIGLAVSAVVPLPVPRYDALLVYVLLLTLGFWLLGLETRREVLVIAGFHLLGLALELFKVRVGSWSYPEDAWTKVGGVPLYAGFMYAAVGSYICQAWRRFDLRVAGYPALITTAVAVAIYLNFFTHHTLPDARWALAALLLVVLCRAWVYFTVGGRRFRLPLAAAFVLIGLFVWVAENLATFVGAWQYPNQEDGWAMVHASKLGSWSLLVSLSFALVAAVKATEGRLYGRPGMPSVVTPRAVSRALERLVSPACASRWSGSRRDAGQPDGQAFAAELSAHEGRLAGRAERRVVPVADVAELEARQVLSNRLQ